MKRILLLALVIRLICLYLFRNVNNYDLQSYLQIGKLTLNGINIYPEIAALHHPYFPFFLYLEAAVFYLKKFSINPILLIKFILIFFDLGNLYFVYLLSKKNLKAGLIYAINPVTILITTFHGQFDAIPLFFLLWSLYLIKVKKEFFSILAFSASVMIKTWPALFILTLLRRLINKKLILLVILFPIISIITYSALFKINIINIIKTVVGYQGLWGIWGIWVLLGKWRIRWQKLSTIIFLTIFFIYTYFNKEKDIVKQIFCFLLFFYIFTPNFSIQYFSWIIPFLIIVKPKNYFLLIIFISLTLISLYSYWVFYPDLKMVPNYLVIIQDAFQILTWILFAYFFKVNGLTGARD